MTSKTHQAELAARILARRRLLSFTQRINPRYLAGWVHHDVCRRLEKFSDDVAKGLSPRLMLLMPPRHGKLLADDTPVPTPSGWKTHGDLNVGDFVFGPDGNPTKILAVSPKSAANMRVELSNGEVFYCHERHAWTVFERGSGQWRTRETEWFTSGVRGARKLLSGNRCVYQLPTAQALKFNVPLPNDLPHPYALGAWLGDGTAQKPCLAHSAPKKPIVAKFVTLGYAVSSVCTHPETGVDTTYFSGTPNSAGRLTRELQKAAVYENKHIPTAYQTAPVEQRLELLAGLIDTDGSVDGKSRVRFTSARENLARQVLELCEGLGFRPYLRSVKPQLSSSGIQGQQVIWVVGFQPTVALPTVVVHKQTARLAPQRRIGFVDVRHDPQNKVGQCIQVDREDGLYVVGKKLTVTHNSELASRMFPAWHLGKHPDHEIIASSYNVGLAMSFSRKVKEVMEDPSYQSVFATRLNPNFQGAEEWGIDNARGGYVAAGVGGGITGKGAHCLLIDDPLKNAEEADSADAREKLKDWYDSTAYTRLAPGGGVLLVQTWWHDDDLAGRLQAAMAADPLADQFVVVKYAALAETDEYLDYDTDLIVSEPPANGQFLRAKGDALHAERYDTDKLHKIKRTIQPRFWSALYQQNPVPDDGAYFLKENFRRGKLPPVARSNVFIAFDFAISEKRQSDYTVGVVGLQDSDDMLHIADVVRFKSKDSFFIVETILNLSKKWYSPSLIMGFEDGQIWRAIESLLKKRMKERSVYPVITVLQPLTDKMARARPLQGRMQQSMVSFSDNAEWYDACRMEMLRFPAGVHDDQVDALAWMTQMAIGRQAPRKPKSEETKSWRAKLAGHLSNNGAGSHMTA